ncbi:MAG TPA: efflux RND transporter periplasmic adaptor subunit [Thermoanaerobaculia bacterium]|nr:efflux RND transporter periplasmic adaptor subunit [Thermoanaerobaculia bacterium]
MKRWMWIAGGVVLLAVIVIASVTGGDPKGEVVYVEPVERRDIQAIVSAPGEVDPKVKVNISAHVIGKIEKLYFNEGDAVQRGDRLVDLERAAYIAQRDRMRSEVANRRIEVSRARISLANAESQYKRAQDLSQQGIQAQELFEQTRLQRDNARAALASAEEAVRQSQAGLAQAENDLERTMIVSPIDGKVVQLSAQEGEVVITGTMNNPGSVIAVIADLSEILVQAEVGETEITGIRVGQEARVRVDALPGRVFEGRVAEIGSSASVRAGAGSGIRYFRVQISLVDPDEALRPGMTSQVEIVTEALKNALTVPIQSVVERDPKTLKARTGRDARAGSDSPLGKYVFIYENENANLRPVTTGISNDTHVAIVSGLKDTDQIVTGPFRTLRSLENEARVRPEEEDEADTKADQAKEEE